MPRRLVMVVDNQLSLLVKRVKEWVTALGPHRAISALSDVKNSAGLWALWAVDFRVEEAFARRDGLSFIT